MCVSECVCVCAGQSPGRHAVRGRAQGPPSQDTEAETQGDQRGVPLTVHRLQHHTGHRGERFRAIRRILLWDCLGVGVCGGGSIIPLDKVKELQLILLKMK